MDLAELRGPPGSAMAPEQRKEAATAAGRAVVDAILALANEHAARVARDKEAAAAAKEAEEGRPYQQAESV